MRTLLKLLSLLLCFELIVSPIQPGLSLLGANAFAQQSCPTGFEYDSILNRCLTKAETANVMNATMNCGGDVECYKQNAQKAFQDKVNAGDAPERKGGGGFVSSVGQAAAVAVPLSLAIGGTKSIMSTCGAPALYAMIAGSLALLAGENLANMQHKSRLKKIKESWGKIVNPEEANGDKDKERETSIEAQSMAFEKLAEAEESMVKAAKMKKTFFTIAALAFTASAALAVMEHMKYTTMMAYPPTAAAAQKIYVCTPKSAASIEKENTSLYAEYSNGRKTLEFPNKQIEYNLKNSTDLVSFITNQKAAQITNSSPSLDDYEQLKAHLSQNEIATNKTYFETFKELSLTVVKNFNPINSAHADEEVNQPGAEENQSGGSSTANTGSGNVDTNAAKAFKEDKGKGFDFLGLGLGVAAGVGVGMMMKSKVVLPLGRAALAGVLAGWTMIMRSHAASQAEASQKRADLLRKMKEEFASASGAIYACKSEDRNDPAKPNCYCYTAENQRNSNRGSSQVCQQLWAGKNLNAGSYTASNTQSDRICISASRQADPTCKCKSSNTCMKVGISGIKGINAGTMSVLGNSLAPVNGISNGSIDAATVNAASLDNQAAKMTDLLKKIENAKGNEKLKKEKDKLALGIQKDLNKAASGMSGGGMFAGSSGSNMPSNPGDAARMLEKELEPNLPTSIGGADTIAAPSGDSSNDVLEFGLTQDDLAAQEGQIAEVMKENLDFGGNDINQGSKTNIFEVLSNRYKRSGMKRLFDEKDSGPAETAAKTDINQ